MKSVLRTPSRGARAATQNNAHQWARSVSSATTLTPDQNKTLKKAKDPDNSGIDPKETGLKLKKTMAQVDEELRLAMEGRAGDGGESGMELEDGKPVSMKRGVKENMFRYI